MCCSLQAIVVVPYREQKIKIHKKSVVPQREQQLFPIRNKNAKYMQKSVVPYREQLLFPLGNNILSYVIFFCCSLQGTTLFMCIFPCCSLQGTIVVPYRELLPGKVSLQNCSVPLRCDSCLRNKQSKATFVFSFINYRQRRIERPTSVLH